MGVLAVVMRGLGWRIGRRVKDVVVRCPISIGQTEGCDGPCLSPDFE